MLYTRYPPYTVSLLSVHFSLPSYCITDNNLAATQQGHAEHVHAPQASRVKPVYITSSAVLHRPLWHDCHLRISVCIRAVFVGYYLPCSRSFAVCGLVTLCLLVVRSPVVNALADTISTESLQLFAVSTQP